MHTLSFHPIGILGAAALALAAPQSIQAKDIFAGPGSAYSTITAAVESQYPLKEDLLVYVIVPTGSYTTQGQIAPSAGDLGGHKITFQGTTVVPVMTFYVDDQAVFEGGTAITFSHENILGPNGQEGRLVAGNPKFIIKDHLGSTRYTVDENASTVDATMYYSYGSMKMLTTSASATREKFTSKEFDTEGGTDGRMNLNYFGARYYDPEGGLWISPDPGRQFNNPYLYVGNNPVNNTDPDGRQCVNCMDISAESMFRWASGYDGKNTIVKAEPQTRYISYSYVEKGKYTEFGAYINLGGDGSFGFYNTTGLSLGSLDGGSINIGAVNGYSDAFSGWFINGSVSSPYGGLNLHYSLNRQLIGAGVSTPGKPGGAVSLTYTNLAPIRGPSLDEMRLNTMKNDN